MIDAYLRAEDERFEATRQEAILLLAQGKAPAEVPNLAYRDGDEVLRTEQRFPPLYEQYPLPARDLLDLSRYTVPFSRRTPATTISTSRGCAHTCTFCPSQIWHKRNVRYRPVALVMEEIEELVHRYGMREICFRDDTFTGNRERVVEICEELLRRGLDLTWRCFGSASTVDADLLALMAAAGCTQICYGFESGDDAVLRKTGKGTTVAQGVDAIRWSKQAGLEVSGTFMVGLEGDTHDTVERSIQFACSNALDYIQVNIAVAMPGTGFGKRRQRKGLDSRPEFFRWSGANTSETATLTAEELPKLARKFYRSFYMRPSYIMSRLTSRRGIQSLHSHAKLGLRMVQYLAEPYLSRSA